MTEILFIELLEDMRKTLIMDNKKIKALKEMLNNSYGVNTKDTGKIGFSHTH